jgi:mono/diheme cytochrome c family protein
MAGVVCAIALGYTLLAAPRGGQGSGGERRTTWSGVYTSEQAKRGETQYDGQCAPCHQFDLQGDGLDVPALADERFRDKWDNRTLRRLFDVISKSMPQQDPGSLTPVVYADILAYILQKNEFPAGSETLSDSAALDSIVMEHRR